MFNIFRADLVGEIAGEEKMLPAGAIDVIGEALLTALAADENGIAPYIIAGPLVLRRSCISAARIELSEIMM